MRTRKELERYVTSVGKDIKDCRIAVGSLIFDKENKVILLERGDSSRDSAGKFEGVGGGVDAAEENLHEALQREIHEEIGEVQVDIKELLTVMILPGSTGGTWVVPIYLCRLKSGEPIVMEPDKIVKIHHFKLGDIPYNKLSAYQKSTMDAYREKYGQEVFDVLSS
ncbi:MAG: NUDIX domain-containing protein [Patescibacteria group bacterium]|jgi:8-oxo-dGTP pyrophosphatase MutT (NUDIX family)